MERLPEIRLITSECEEFLRINRRWIKLKYPDGSESEAALHDGVIRKSSDAVAIVAHSGKKVYLRSCVRPNVGETYPDDLNLWEVPAGLGEGGEDPVAAAVRETREELGFEVKEEEFSRLGGFVYSMVGMGPERI